MNNVVCFAVVVLIATVLNSINPWLNMAVAVAWVVTLAAVPERNAP